MVPTCPICQKPYTKTTAHNKCDDCRRAYQRAAQKRYDDEHREDINQKHRERRASRKKGI